MPKVIVITGPCGAGKTTISKLVAEELGIPHLQGDDVKEDLFPGLVDISKHPNELSAVKDELLKRAKEKYRSGQSVVVDYIVLGKYIEEFQDAFGKDLVIKVLLASVKVMTHRDTHRDCWTAGPEHIEELRDKFRRDEPLIGKENFFETSEEPPEKTAARLLKSIPLDTNS